MRRKTLAISITVVLCLLGGYFYLSNRPLYLASSPELIPDFFSLPKDEIVWGKGFVIDELHSQGRKFEDFGSSYYAISICPKSPSIRRKMRERDETIDTGHSLILTVKRGDILGTFELLHNSSKAYVHYTQIYDY